MNHQLLLIRWKGMARLSTSLMKSVDLLIAISKRVRTSASAWWEERLGGFSKILKYMDFKSKRGRGLNDKCRLTCSRCTVAFFLTGVVSLIFWKGFTVDPSFRRLFLAFVKAADVIEIFFGSFFLLPRRERSVLNIGSESAHSRSSGNDCM